MSQSNQNLVDPLLEAVFSITEYVYSILAELPEAEKWDTTAKLRSTANELLYRVALALGSSEPDGAKYDWSSAHKQALAMRTMYRFATKQNFVELEPAIMVRIDKIINDIVSATARSQERATQLDQEQLADLRKENDIFKGIK